MANWDKFFEEVMEIPLVEKVKEWCEANGVQFEPYARVTNSDGQWTENELMCTCCFFGDIDSNKPYLSFKIGDNGSFEKIEREEHECDVEDCTCNGGEGENGCGYYEEDVEKDTWDMISEYEKELENLYISHELPIELMKEFCDFMGVKMPDKNSCIILKEVENEDER